MRFACLTTFPLRYVQLLELRSQLRREEIDTIVRVCMDVARVMTPAQPPTHALIGCFDQP